MAYIGAVVNGSVGNKQDEVAVPDDLPVEGLLVVLVDKLRYQKYSGDGGQSLCCEPHHVVTEGG